MRDKEGGGCGLTYSTIPASCERTANGQIPNRKVNKDVHKMGAKG